MSKSEQENNQSAGQLDIAIQGVHGAFHDIAARYYLRNARYRIREAAGFEDVVQHVTCGEDHHRGMMAIENTLFGSLMDNYQLISDADIRIEGEVYLRIHQNLLALEGQTIDDLSEVHSHPIAIAQCRAFFHRYPHIKLIETDDTAASAKRISETASYGVGAIASTLAAEIYGLQLMARGIESNKANFTRFLALAPASQNQLESGDKASMWFTVDHAVGSLYRVLGALASIGVNLTKIQSAPIIGKPWEYKFFVDFLMNQPGQFDEVREVLRHHTHESRILGRYKQGMHYEN
jgi:prephenate dehydratase